MPAASALIRVQWFGTEGSKAGTRIDAEKGKERGLRG
jgi:hypothetical protein